MKDKGRFIHSIFYDLKSLFPDFFLLYFSILVFHVNSMQERASGKTSACQHVTLLNSCFCVFFPNVPVAHAV